MNHDDRGPAAGPSLNVRIEREVARIAYVSLDARDDVVAVRIVHPEGRARLRERRRLEREDGDQEEDDRH
jgi:hypothetical protein